MSWFQDHVHHYQPSYVNEDLNKDFQNGRLEFIEDEMEEILLNLEIKDVSTDPITDEPE